MKKALKVFSFISLITVLLVVFAFPISAASASESSNAVSLTSVDDSNNSYIYGTYTVYSDDIFAEDGYCFYTLGYGYRFKTSFSDVIYDGISFYQDNDGLWRLYLLSSSDIATLVYCDGWLDPDYKTFTIFGSVPINGVFSDWFYANFYQIDDTVVEASDPYMFIQPGIYKWHDEVDFSAFSKVYMNFSVIGDPSVPTYYSGISFNNGSLYYVRMSESLNSFGSIFYCSDTLDIGGINYDGWCGYAFSYFYLHSDCFVYEIENLIGYGQYIVFDYAVGVPGDFYEFFNLNVESVSYTELYAECYKYGKIEGYNVGYDNGFDAGDEFSYDIGYDAGYDIGHSNGYNSGVAASVGDGFFGDIFGNITDGISRVVLLEYTSSSGVTTVVTLWTVFGTIVVIMIVLWVLRLIAGG